MVFCRATTLVARGRHGQKYTIIAVFFNPFPLRDFPYLTTFAGAEKVTPLHTYLPLKRHEPQALWLYEISYCHWRNVVTVIQCRWAEKVTLPLLQNGYNGHKKTARLLRGTQSIFTIKMLIFLSNLFNIMLLATKWASVLSRVVYSYTINCRKTLYSYLITTN